MKENSYIPLRFSPFAFFFKLLSAVLGFLTLRSKILSRFLFWQIFHDTIPLSFYRFRIMYSRVSGSDISFFLIKCFTNFHSCRYRGRFYNFIKSLSPQNCVFCFQATALMCMQPWQRNSGAFIRLFVFFFIIFWKRGGGLWDGAVCLYSCEPVMNLLTFRWIIVCEHGSLVEGVCQCYDTIRCIY